MAVSIRWSDQWARIAPPAARRQARQRPVRHIELRRRIAWRRIAAIASDLFMVLIWAAMIPGFMWLGTAAGF